MKLIVGLGNPGEKYEETRHNTGFKVVDKIGDSLKVAWEKDGKFDALIAKSGENLLVKPQTFMNSSGESVQKLVNFYKIETSDIWVIHDDLDIKLGQYKIQKGTGPKEHNGVASIDTLLGSKDYWRVRVGVDARDEVRINGEDYVLQKFPQEELVILGKVIEEITGEIISRI